MCLCEEATALDASATMLGLGMIALGILTIVLYLCWVYRAYKNLGRLGLAIFASRRAARSGGTSVPS